jgi:hypothetical protein
MLFRFAVPALALAYAGYRIALTLQIARAKRAGDTARLAELRTKGFGLYRWALRGALVLIVLLAILVMLESRQT